MSDIERRLTGAGERWRARNDIAAPIDTAGPGPSGDSVVVPAKRHRRREWLAPLAAAAVLVLIVVGVQLGSHQASDHNVAPAPVVIASTVASRTSGIPTTPSGTVTQTSPSTRTAVVHHDPSALYGKVWQLVSGTWHGKPLSLMSEAGAPTDPDGSPPRSLAPDVQLTFVGAHEVNGRDGCNYLFGAMTASAGHLNLSGMEMSAMGCSGAATMEQAVLSILTGTVEFSIVDSHLHLVRAGVGELIYEPIGPAPTTAPSSTPESTPLVTK